MINGYDDWKLSNGQEDEKIYCECDYCGREIYVDDEYYYIEMFGENIHTDCFYPYCSERIDKSYWVAGE